MKRLIPVVILMILSVVILFSVNNNDETLKYETDSSQVDNSKSISNIEVHSNETVQSSAYRYSEIENNINDILNANNLSVFINAENMTLNNDNLRISDNQFLLVPFMADGQVIQYDFILSNEDLINFALTNKNIKVLYAKDYYNETSTHYETLQENDILAIYSGNRNLIKNKVLYVDYRIDDREPEQRWINYFSQKFKESIGETDSPIIIKCAYIFECNGHKCEYVVASNVSDTSGITAYMYNSQTTSIYKTLNDCDIIPNIPFGDNHHIYRLEALFIDESSIADNFSRTYECIGKCNLYSENDIFSNTFLPPLVDRRFYVNYYSYQYDENNNIISCPIYTFQAVSDDYDLNCNNYIFVGGIDGDGYTELFTYYYHGFPLTSLLSIIDGDIKYK